MSLMTAVVESYDAIRDPEVLRLFLERLAVAFDRDGEVEVRLPGGGYAHGVTNADLAKDRRVAEEIRQMLGATSPLVIVQPAALPRFRGDLAWIHQWEGHAGRPYWPKGRSGISLDPGVDLGHCERELIRAYEGILSGEQFAAIVGVYEEGLRGDAAEHVLKRGSGRPLDSLRSIRITRKQAEAIFPVVAAPYWRAIVERFPELVDERTPPEVQTALLSLAYNRGAGNKGLRVLAVPLSGGDWITTAFLIKEMQQDHPLEGIQKRRRAEGDLILNRQGTAG